MKKLLALLPLSFIWGCGIIKPPPPPVPKPTPPPPVSSQALHVEGKRFLTSDGKDPKIQGAIVGCHLEGVQGWPGVCQQSVDALRDAGLDWTHIRTGAFTVEGESPAFAFYLKNPDGSYDLSKINPDYQNLIKQTVDNNPGYTEVDLPLDRWVVQHHKSPWPDATLDMFQHLPSAEVEAAVRAVVHTTCDNPRVIYSLGNDGLKMDSHLFYNRIIEIVRDECKSP